jgi:hypothetical protein
MSMYKNIRCILSIYIVYRQEDLIEKLRETCICIYLCAKIFYVFYLYVHCVYSRGYEERSFEKYVYVYVYICTKVFYLFYLHQYIVYRQEDMCRELERVLEAGRHVSWIIGSYTHV